MVEGLTAILVLSGGALGAIVSPVASVILTRRSMLRFVEGRLERIENMLTAPDQAWYWTPEWQAGEAEAHADRAAGRSTTFDSPEAFLSALDAIPAADPSGSAATRGS